MKFTFKPVEPPPWISPSEWQDSQWQFSQALKNLSDFQRYFELSNDEIQGFSGLNKIFQVRVTPYYAQLADKTNPSDPIRQILSPHQKELNQGEQQLLDPLAERKNNPTPRIIHRYSDRVLFLVTDFCSVYCRYCTRKHFTGKNQAFISQDDYQKALDYIKAHSGIREVILSGGDPLTLSDERLFKILKDLRSIEHVEIIRIGSRIPVVNPFRITKELVEGLKPYFPIYLMTHFNHPKELTFEAAQGLKLFADHGVPMMNQMVLLNGVNNHPAIVQALSRRLLYLRVKPYYMFQCDPSEGTDHLRTSVEDSLSIQQELWGHLSGLAMPTLSLDIPDGGGKVSFAPNYLIKEENGTRRFRGWDGVEGEYINPKSEDIKKPLDFKEYEAEWLELKRARDGRV